jgi:D-3-phosphoglycerate dehydrogenase / 2-oxoglutarate reductase
MSCEILCAMDMSGAEEGVARLNEVGNLILIPADREAVLSNLANCTAYIAHAAIQVDSELLAHAPNLKVIGSPSTGTDHMDLPAIRAADIDVFDIAKETELLNSFSATAEHAFGLSFAVARHLVPAVQSAKQAIWAREHFLGMQFLNKTLGILGLGRLGTIAARIGQGFGMRVIANDIRDVSMDGVETVNFNTLISEADILQIHVHLNDDTRGIINAPVFERMKPTAFLINTSRGAIIDEASLLAALSEQKIAGAGLDVIDGEWLDEDELRQHPLIRYMQDHDNLVITPHTASSTPESMFGARDFIAKKIARYIQENYLAENEK